MTKRRKVFDMVIVDLIQVGSIYQYLVNGWHRKHIIVSIWENGIRQPQRIMTDYATVQKLYHYLLQWKNKKIKLVIYET